MTIEDAEMYEPCQKTRKQEGIEHTLQIYKRRITKNTRIGMENAESNQIKYS